MKKLNAKLRETNDLYSPIVIQFGEGNFLRAFFDYLIDVLNEKSESKIKNSVIVVQPIEKGLANVLNEQDGLYTLLMRGMENGEPITKTRLCKSVEYAVDPYADYHSYRELEAIPSIKYIVSNTTESGIVYEPSDKLTDEPPRSFPGKITQLLYHRWLAFDGDVGKGFIFIPCELIEKSGDVLRDCVLKMAANWELPEEFIEWLDSANHFCNTLVDRIVTGYPRDETREINARLGYVDDLLVTSELFFFFALEGEQAALDEMAFFADCGLDVVLTQDVTPYKIRKVRILNGAHTASVLAAALCGKKTVLEMIETPLFAKLLERAIYQEIIPTINLDIKEIESFAESVFERFANPFIKHYLTSIALNSVSKFAARILPTIFDYKKIYKEWPPVLMFSLVSLIVYYKGSETHVPEDAPEVTAFFEEVWAKEKTAKELANAVCKNSALWGRDLSLETGFVDLIAQGLESVQEKGFEKTLEILLS